MMKMAYIKFAWKESSLEWIFLNHYRMNANSTNEQNPKKMSNTSIAETKFMIAETKSENEVALNQSIQDEMVMDAINSIQKPNSKDGLLPVFDVNIRDETPKVVLSFVKERPNSSVPNDKVEIAKFEEFIRFQPFIRVNKVSWSPKGDVIAVGYRNGLISLMPGSFDDIFAA